jgi:hypothetical protein
MGSVEVADATADDAQLNGLGTSLGGSPAARLIHPESLIAQ